jgi:hypothetical protein
MLRQVAVLAWYRFLDLAIREPQRLRTRLPWLEQDGRIARDSFVVERENRRGR